MPNVGGFLFNKIRLRKLKKPRVMLNKLQYNSTSKQMYADRFKSKFNCVEETRCSKWNRLEDAQVILASEFITKQEKKKWMTNEILDMMKK